MAVCIRTEEEITIMREAGRITASVLETVMAAVQPGITTQELDNIAGTEVIKLGALPSFKGYHGFPANLCTSINDEVVHGIPNNRVLCDGDIISLDFGVIYKGYQGDAARTVGVGNISSLAAQLIEVTHNALNLGIVAARAGQRTNAIGIAIESYVKYYGFSVVREYIGHGIGTEMHEDPEVPSSNKTVFGQARLPGPILKKGMVIAIEPMVNTGSWRVRVSNDYWTVKTLDKSWSAHFEDTIVITDDIPERLTKI
jgi:methionyl aminopeptidase